jgi:pyridoxal phosphate enzyme (YggS family)
MQNAIQQNYQALRQALPSEVLLVAVSKTKPIEALLQAYEAGCRDFGENKVQEMQPKYEALPKDIRWHLIGHLQSNKVKYIAPFVHCIHSIDSLKLLQEVNKQAAKAGRVIECLLQIFIAEEDTKFGLSFEEAENLLASEEIKSLKNTKIKGLMGMATFTEDEAQIRREFRSLADFFARAQSYNDGERIALETLSMGMSGDYALAIEEGSSLVRVGSAIFGSR